MKTGDEWGEILGRATALSHQKRYELEQLLALSGLFILISLLTRHEFTNEEKEAIDELRRMSP